MSNGSIEVRNESVYTISVNGIEDLIKLDLTDLSLPAKLMDLSQKCTEADEKLRQKMEALGEIDTNNTDQIAEVLSIINDECNELRKIVDAFLGKGVCQAIFGDTNYFNMFTDLFEALKPEFEKAIEKGNLSMEKMQKSLGDKYKPNDKKVL